MKSQKSSGGWKIAPFGADRNAIVPDHANELVKALNAIGALDVVYDETLEQPSVKFSDGRVVILIPNPANLVPDSGLTVTESDASPSVSEVTEIRFPDGTVTEVSPGIVSIDVAAASADNPWRVYRSDPAALKFRVTQGYIVTDGDAFSPINHTSEFTLSPSSTYWAYVVINGTDTTIYFSTTRPAWSLETIAIARIVTPATAAETDTILQLLAENIQIPCL